ncbi:hypothetical protein F5X96DRAFT_646066 [Biscogniauxia mediterranea]|nr:hypothetical protein F5X96DRAFT_646066 [Biscogniauxia mediterranea]
MFRTTEYLVPNILRRQQHRSKPYATIISTEGVQRHIKYSDIENASNRASWFLAEKVADDKVFYMGSNDIRYLIWIIAAMKTGKCVLLPSPSNQIPANQRFFKRVGAKTLLYAPEAADMLAPLLGSTKETIEHIASPTFEALFHNDIVPIYPFEKIFDDVKDTIFMGLHTSGTSGHPKPIYWNHLALSTAPSFLDTSIVPLDGGGINPLRDFYSGDNDHNLLASFPLYHFGGIGSSLFSLYCNNTLVFPAVGTILSPDNLTTIIQKGHCTSAALAPSMLEAMLSYPAGMDALATLKSIAYGGGPLNPHRGEILAKKLPCLINILASTEGGLGHFQLSKDSSCSGFFKFIELGQRMEEVSPGIYELVYPRTELINRTHAFFHTNPDLEVEFRTSDLFSPVKGKEGYWEYKGRKDNWIAMSNGLKMDPTEMESTISAHPDVSGALVAGSHRFRLCLLIELKAKSAAPELNTIWPTIEAANKKVTKFGRVPKELVIFAPAGKPFSRASKGTVQRIQTVHAFEEEINKRYEDVEEGLLTSGIALPSSTEAQELMPFLTELCSETLLEDTDNSNISVDDNLLAFGLDSLSAFVLIARLKAALRAYGVEPEKVQRVDSRLIYSATTIRQLAVNLSGMLSEIETSNGSVEHRINDLMVELLEKYNAEIQKLPRGISAQTREKSNIKTCILTGSSGSLGSYILSSLLSRGDVKKVFCLNRKTDAQAQSTSFKIRGLPELSVDDGRVVFLQVKPTEPKLELSDDTYDSLVQETTSIIHNAYPVNFLLSLESMEPQFEFLLNLLRLAAKGPKNPGVLFVSSIAAASSTAFNGSQIKIPEKVLDLDQAKNLLPQGYARSKYICERLVANYASQLGRLATVLRVGQVCGPLSGGGTWNASEWIPSLVQSSKFLGAVPESLGGQEVNWVPVDKLGDITAQIVCAAAPRSGDLAALTVYNVVNPSTTSWAELLPGLKGAGPLEVVSAAEWVDRLEKSDKGHHVIHMNPAAKLVDFYKEALLDSSPVAKFEVSNLLGASEIAASMQPITADNMAKWLRGWGL